MKVELLGLSPIQDLYSYNLIGSSIPGMASSGSVMSKDEMERLMNLVMYNQFAMAEKLARIVSQMYAGMNFEGLA